MLTTSPSFLSGVQTAKYFNVAGLAVWVYDYCITFNSEVHWVWGRKWDLARITFTVARYMAFIGAIMTVYTAVKTRTGDCNPFAAAADVVHLLGFISAEGLLIIRTYAFWQCNKKLLIGLLVFGALIFTGAIVESSLVNVPAGFSNPGNCIFADSKDSSVQYAFLVVFEFVLLYLHVHQKFRKYPSNTSRLIAVLYRDGVLYIIRIICISLTNIIFIVAAPVAYSNSLDTLQLVLHSIFASRILFDLRQTGEQPEFNLVPLSVSRVQFATRIEDDVARQLSFSISPGIRGHRS